ncbi:MAG: hypothetical protein ACFCVE_07955, partial [Phycisphaerae bacterium]
MTPAPRTTRHTVPAEALEARRLLAVATFIDGIAGVVGTDARDEIVFTVDPDNTDLLRANVNGTFNYWDIDRVTQINLVLGGGDDAVDFDETTAQITIPVFADGGEGDDIIRTASGD